MFALLRTLAEKSGLAASRCPLCGKLTYDEPGAPCETCAQSLSPRTGGFCPRCGEIFGDDDAPPTVCPDCLHTPRPWAQFMFHSVYAGPLRDLILTHKFGRSFNHARLMARLAGETFARHAVHVPDGVVPVPLHRRRLAWRGFNQSTELGRALGKRLAIPVLDRALVRTRHTPPQTRLGHDARQANIKDAFAADPSLVRGKQLLLVDDVCTTGATLHECARTLNRAGAAGVDVLVLARSMGS